MDTKAEEGYVASWTTEGTNGETTVTEAEWLACSDPQKMLELLRGKASDRKLRLFACACCRRVWHSFADDFFRQAIEETERTTEDTEGMPEEAVPWWLRLSIGPALPPHLVGEVDVYDGVKSILPVVAWTYADGQAASWLAAHSEADPIWRSHVAKLRRASVTAEEASVQSCLLRDVVGIPCRAISLEPTLLQWNDAVVVRLAQAAYEERHMPEGTLDNVRLAVLADALEEAGCTDAEILGHLRGPGLHVRGCWAVDLCLGKS